MRLTALICGLLLLAAPAAPAAAQVYDPASRMAAQREAIARLAIMDGVWRGPAWSISPAGRHDIVQTERIGPFLGGTVKVIEGRGYAADGSVGFNALGVISYEPNGQTYSMNSWALSYAGSFPLRMTGDGYVWERPAGPGAVVRYTATIAAGRWREVGEMIAGDAPPRQIFEMNLVRVGDSAWPAADPVPMR
ncbi:MAG: DUF1579 domain-containing protein [Sphingosinicella sp.]